MNTKELLERANQIRNETKDGANTAERVGSLLVDMITFFSGEIDSSISVDKENVNAIRQSSSVVINVTSDTDWRVSQHPSWLAIDKMIGPAGTTAVTITINVNTTNISRTGNIDWETTDGNASTRTTVTQTADGDYIISSFSSPLNFDYEENGAGAQTGVVTSNKTVEVTTSAVWVKCENTGGNNYEIWTTPNSGAARAGSVTFRPQGVTTPSVTVVVTQDASPSPKFEAVPSDIVNVPASGGTRTVQLYCTNENWLLTYVPNWVNVEPNTGTDDAVLTVTIEPNTGAARNEAIQIDNLGTGATLEIGVYQLAASSGKYLNVSDYYYNNNGIAATRQIGVDTNVDDLIIEVADYPSWLEDAFLSASNDTLNLLYGANPNSTPQFAVVKFVSEKYPEVNKDFYAINGAPAGLDYSVLIPPGDGGVIEQERSAGTIKTYLFDNVTTYLDDEGTSWFSGIDYDAEPGKGKVVKIYPKANTASTERIANIICKRGSDDEILSGIEVRQSATGYYIEHDGEPNIIVGSSAVTVSRTITVGTSIPNNPTATSEATWINSIKVTPMVNDDFNVQFKVAVNSTGVERTGIVRVTFMDVHYDFSITQGK